MHSLFLVHGMGAFAGKPWAQEIWDGLVRCSLRYPHFKTHPLGGYAEPVAIQYDDLLNAALARWDRQAQSFQAFARENALPGEGALDWLAGVSSDTAGFLLTHVTDVVIYRFFPYEREQIRTRVLRDVYSTVQAKRASDPQARFSVLAHSLGTAVSHDALAEMASARKIEGNQNAYSALNFKFDSIHMLANVSRLLETEPRVYESFVRPGAADEADRNCLSLFSHRHVLDPFTRPKPFRPEGWGPRFTLTPELDHYRSWDVHGWLHYLDHPRVHVPLLRSLSKPSAISPAQESAAYAAYPRFGAALANLNLAREKLAELGDLIAEIDAEKGLRENFELLRESLQTLVELREVAGDTWRQLEGSLT